MRETGVEPEIVWNTIIDGFLRGTNFNDQEMGEFITKALPANFLDDLANASAQTTIERLIKELRSSEATPSLKSSWPVRKLKRMVENHLESMGRIYF